MNPLIALFFIGVLLVSIKPLSAAYTGTKLEFNVDGINKLRMDGTFLKGNLMLEVVNPTSNTLTLENLNLKIYTPDKKQLAHINTKNMAITAGANKATKISVPFSVEFNTAMTDIVLPGIQSFFKMGFKTDAFIKQMPDTMRITGTVDILNLPAIPVDTIVDVKKQLA